MLWKYSWQIILCNSKVIGQKIPLCSSLSDFIFLWYLPSKHWQEEGKSAQAPNVGVNPNLSMTKRFFHRRVWGTSRRGIPVTVISCLGSIKPIFKSSIHVFMCNIMLLRRCHLSPDSWKFMWCCIQRAIFMRLLSSISLHTKRNVGYQYCGKLSIYLVILSFKIPIFSHGVLEWIWNSMASHWSGLR